MTVRKHGKSVNTITRDHFSGFNRLAQVLNENGRILEDRRSDDRGDADRRKEERATVDTPASLRASFGQGIEGHLDDLSVYGCKIRLAQGSFAVGQIVFFRIDSIQPWRGTVRWASGRHFGVEFDCPFYPAVFEHILQMNKTVACSRAA